MISQVIINDIWFMSKMSQIKGEFNKILKMCISLVCVNACPPKAFWSFNTQSFRQFSDTAAGWT